MQNKLDLLKELVKTSFKLRYQNSLLGFVWVLIKPYSTFIVMYFIWTRIARFDIPNYALYLLVGIVMYTYCNELVILGQKSLLERANIILKVNFPRYIAITSALITALINLFINLIFVAIILFINNINVSLEGIVNFLIIVITMFIFGIGLSFFTSILTVRFRDLENVFELAMFLLYWGTPIFYDLSSNFINNGIGQIIQYNPLGIMINQARASFNIYGTIDFRISLVSLTIAIIFAALGWSFFKSRVRKISEYF